jgi:hypothetical protein
MIREDEDALICDLAETYRIYDYRSLPARTVATFAVGLRNDSRIKMRLSGEPLTFEQMMMVKIYDLLNWLDWVKIRENSKSKSKPPERLEDKIRKKAAKKSDTVVFNSVKDFETARHRMIEGLKDG